MIFVDADSCPVKEIIIDVAKTYHEGVKMFFDSSHVYESDYATVKIVEKGHDSVDMYILKEISTGDILVTQDYGLASLALTKNAFVITTKGMRLTNSNIDFYLTTRYFGQVERKEDKHIKGPKKRTDEDNKSFRNELVKLMEEL